MIGKWWSQALNPGSLRLPSLPTMKEFSQSPPTSPSMPLLMVLIFHISLYPINTVAFDACSFGFQDTALSWFPSAQMIGWSLVALLFLSTLYMLVSPQALSLALSSWSICALWVSLCTPEFNHPLDTGDSKTYFWSPYHAQHGSELTPDFLHFQSDHAPLCLRSVSKAIACLVI